MVHVAYEDAVAYAKWAGGRLPTEAEWEFAARGGLAGKLYPWGDELRPGGKWMANIYEGRFPVKGADTGADGFAGLAPVAQYPPNAYGLYDVAGNAWEWVSDWYRPDYYATLAAQPGVARDPRGPESSFDPAEPGEPKRVHRGGLVPVRRGLLHALHDRHARQGRGAHRHQPSRLPLRARRRARTAVLIPGTIRTPRAFSSR